MARRTTSEIDDFIREEMRMSALESQSETWANGRLAGIEPEILAEAALATAFQELLRGAPADTALALVERMRERIEAGEFDPDRVWH